MRSALPELLCSYTMVCDSEHWNNVECYPDECAGNNTEAWCHEEVKVYDYELGDAIVVDGRAPHRTAPFTAHDLAKVNGERVLVCLNYASTQPSARPAQQMSCTACRRSSM